MKVLFISRRFYPEIIGGGQISALYIAKAVQKQGCDVKICTFTDNKRATVKVKGISVEQIPIPQMKLFPRLSNMDYMYVQMARLSSKVIKEFKPDIIHLLNFESIPLSSIYFKKKFGIPLVATVNGPLFGCFTQRAIDFKGKTCIKCRVGKRFLCSIDEWGKVKGTAYYGYSLWYMNMLRLSYKYVDKFFAVSSAMIPLLTNMGVPKRKITVIHNPIEKKKKVKSNLKKELGIVGKKVILYAGRLAKEKGIQYVISAMSYLPNHIFIVLGKKKNYYFQLLNLVKKLKLSNVIFTGYIENDKTIDYYSIANIVVLLGDFYEPLSRMLLEAQSYNIPLLVSNKGGNKEIIITCNNGKVNENNNPLNIANNIKYLTNIKKKKDKKNPFSLLNIGRKLCNEYKMLIKK